MSFIPKKYFYDKTVLLLASVLSFLLVATLVSIALRLGSGQGGTDFIVEYRSNAGISAFQTGDITAIFSFMAFALVTFIVSLVLSIRSYLIKREVSFAILVFGVLIMILTAIVSNALLALR